MFGLFLKLDDRLAVVIGGGPVGRRKAQALLDAGAAVRLVCLEERPVDAGAVEWLTQPYEARHLDGASLVIAAATRGVNARVIADARARGVWACDAAEPGEGDFVTPATVRRGEVVVALTTGVPALTRRLRERLEGEIGPEWATWAVLLAGLRPRILSAVPEPRREELWRALTDGAWLDRLRDGDAAVAAEMEELVRLAEQPIAPPSAPPLPR